MYDYLVVGAGMFGCTFSRHVAEKGKKVLIVDGRDHIGGNCYTKDVGGIHVHKYGPHSFHTNSDVVWFFLNRFAKFNNFQAHTKVNYQGKIFSFPVNLMTLNQLWGVTTPEEAESVLKSVRIPCDNPSNLEDWILSQVGEEIYETFIKGYTAKQWNRHPSLLPSSIIKRLPIRLNYDDRYFDDKYQGIPIGGYTAMFENMIDHENIKISLNTFYEHSLRSDCRKLVYTGRIDEFFDYKFGALDYRSLRFEESMLEGNFQGNAIMNFTETNVPLSLIHI